MYTLTPYAVLHQMQHFRCTSCTQEIPPGRPLSKCRACCDSQLIIDGVPVRDFHINLILNGKPPMSLFWDTLRDLINVGIS